MYQCIHSLPGGGIAWRKAGVSFAELLQTVCRLEVVRMRVLDGEGMRGLAYSAPGDEHEDDR